MPENPLLPNAELRALHLLLQAADRYEIGLRQPTGVPKRSGSKEAGPPRGAQALFAAAVLQMEAGDLAVAGSESEAIATLLKARGRPARHSETSQVVPSASGVARLMMAAGLAAAMRRSGEGRFVLSATQAGEPEQLWADAMTWAQQDSLPMITLCLDASGAGAFREPAVTSEEGISWSALQRVAETTKLPVLSVDGQDAVAVYRVVQESILRVRSLGGPVVIWAVLPTEKETRRLSGTSSSPLGRMEEYLRVRKLLRSPRKAKQ